MNLQTTLKRWQSGRIFRLSAGNSKLFQLRNRHCYWPELGSIEHYASEFSKVRPGLTFVQAGSGDDILTDPIHRIIKRDHWRGVVVEQDAVAFRNTVEPLYRYQQGVETINALIGEVDSESEGSVTVKSLLSGYKTGKVDWLQIWNGESVVKILKLFNAAGIKPSVVVYSRPDKRAEDTDVKSLITADGYLVKNFGTMALAAIDPDEYLSRFLAE